MNASFPIVQVAVFLVGAAIWFFVSKPKWDKVGEVLMFAGALSACLAAH